MKLATLTTSALVVASIILSSEIAIAQTGMTGNYIGAGVSAGLTHGIHNNDDAVFGGNVQGRFAVPQTPISARGAVLFGGDAVAIVPTITYDVPIAKKTNLYIGGGYSFNTSEGRNTQLGTRDATVLTLGAESELSKNIVAYGDAKWAIDAYKNSSGDAVSLQAGVGLRF
jgi:opacity protein-like surface antigen